MRAYRPCSDVLAGAISRQRIRISPVTAISMARCASIRIRAWSWRRMLELVPNSLQARDEPRISGGIPAGVRHHRCGHCLPNTAAQRFRWLADKVEHCGAIASMLPLTPNHSVRRRAVARCAQASLQS